MWSVPGRSRRAFVAIWATCAAAYAAFIASCTFVVHGTRAITLFDDAMISMRYARNLVEGGGLTWNPGEAHVEGYTNLLWTLWMAAVHVVPLPELQLAVLIVVTGVVLLVVTGRCVVALTAHLELSVTATAIALACTLLCYGLVYWTLRGMEVGLLACAVTLGTWRLVRFAATRARRDLVGVTICGAVAILTRTDAAVFVTVWIAFAICALRGRERRIAAGVLIGVLVAALAATTVFRILYYGPPLPNTYYLKLEGISLGTRLARGALSIVHLLQIGWLVPVALAGFAFTRREHRSTCLLLAGLVAGATAYSIYVGGDAWEEFDIPNRYMSPALPALFVLAALGLDAIAASADRARVLALLLLAFAALQLVTLFPPLLIHAWWPSDATRYARIAVAVAFALALLTHRLPARGLLGAALLVAIGAERWVDFAGHGAAHAAIDADRTRHGLAIRAATTDDATLATTPAGNIPYFAHRRTIDLLGKSDPRVAHLAPRTTLFHPGHVKWDYAYSIGELQPDLIDELFIPPDGSLVEADLRRLPSWGYVQISPTIYVHAGRRGVDSARLLHELGR